jgi:hypothetical protein
MTKSRAARTRRGSSAAAIAREARREAQRLAAEVAGSAAARRARARAHEALDALSKAAGAATALVQAAWRTSGAHIHTLASSRDVRALQARARRAAQAVATTLRAAGVTAAKRGEKIWAKAAAGARGAVSRAPARRAARRPRAGGRRKTKTG